MILMHSNSEHPVREPFTIGYRRARTALILHLAATSGIRCHYHLSYPDRGYADNITVESSPRTFSEFAKLRDFLEGLQENGLLSHFDDVEEQELTPEERSWLADYGLCESAEARAETDQIYGGET